MSRLRTIPLDCSPAEFAAFEERVETAALNRYLERYDDTFDGPEVPADVREWEAGQ